MCMYIVVYTWCSVHIQCSSQLGEKVAKVKEVEQNGKLTMTKCIILYFSLRTIG